MRAGYLEVARVATDRVRLIDASGSVEETEDEMLAILESFLGESG